jgi:hypothetical protein
MAKGLLDVKHHWFRPLWARAVFTGLIGLWTVMEILRNAPFWAVLFGAMTGWLIYQWFIVFDPKDYEKPKDPDA